MSSYEEKTNLKLIGRNWEDLNVISAYLQDSIVAIKDIAFLQKNKTFIMIVNRFMWEDIEKGVFRDNKRIKCVIKFENVIKVKSKNINQKNKKKLLECLAIKGKLTVEETYEMKIFFSGDSVITIASEIIDLFIHDLGKPWKVKHTPMHKI